MTGVAPPAPLAGVRVLDLSRVLAGPYCTMMLADLGADVVKVERPGVGDQSRAWGPPFVGGESTYFLSSNRGKRSLAADVQDPAGLEVVLRLARGADVVVENFVPGGADRLGLGFDELRALNPRVVYTSIRGYPHDSPEADQPGFDFAIQGAAGLMSVTGSAESGPMKVGIAISDITAGMMAASATLAALFDVQRGSAGRRVEVSLFDAQAGWLANRGSEALIGGVEPELLGNAHPSIVPYETFRAADGYVNLAVGTDGQFRSFCAVSGLTALADDPRFATNRDRVQHRAELVPQIAAAFAPRTVRDWLDALAAAKVPAGPVRTIPELAREAPWTTVEHEHPAIGTMRSFRSPFVVDGTHRTAATAPPQLGQHTAEILRELGYAGDELAALLAGPCAQHA